MSLRTRHLLVTKDCGLYYTMRLDTWDWLLFIDIGDFNRDYGQHSLGNGHTGLKDLDSFT